MKYCTPIIDVSKLEERLLRRSRENWASFAMTRHAPEQTAIFPYLRQIRFAFSEVKRTDITSKLRVHGTHFMNMYSCFQSERKKFWIVFQSLTSIPPFYLTLAKLFLTVYSVHLSVQLWWRNAVRRSGCPQANIQIVNDETCRTGRLRILLSGTERRDGFPCSLFCNMAAEGQSPLRENHK